MRNGAKTVIAAALFGTVFACNQSSDPISGSTASALSSAVVAETSASGTLICAPSQTQIDACGGKAANDACSLTAPDGVTAVAGTCRATVDGTTVACAPNPPVPPQALVDACSGLAADDACTLPDRDGRTIAGTCTTGPTGTAPLFCSPTRVKADATAACAGLADGSACTLTSDPMLRPAASARPGQSPLLPRDSVSGTCTTPAGGGSPVCVVACVDLRGSFDCARERDGDHGHRGRR